MPNFSTETKVFSVIILATVFLVGGAAFLLGSNNTNSSKVVSDQSLLVRDNSHVIGPDNAKVTVVEFSDFTCPACQVTQQEVAKMIDFYKSQSVRFVYRQYPLSSHTYSLIAAQGAEAAGKQGKFWEMYTKLFQLFYKNPDVVVTKEILIGFAKDLNLNESSFSADLDSDSVRQAVANDQADGGRLGLRVTPTFFINGTRFESALTFNQFKEEVNSRLK